MIESIIVFLLILYVVPGICLGTYAAGKKGHTFIEGVVAGALFGMLPFYASYYRKTVEVCRKAFQDTPSIPRKHRRRRKRKKKP